MKRSWSAVCLVAVLLLVAGCSGSAQHASGPAPAASAEPAAPSATAPGVTGTTPVRQPAATTDPLPVGPAGVAVPAGFTPTSATFVSVHTGWVLGRSPCPRGSGACDVVARTRDGGRTWRAIPAPATSPDQLSQIRFADLRNGFVTGAQLWATHDGGGTWQVVPGHPDVAELEAADGRVWLVDHGLLSGPAGGGALLREAAPADAAGLVLHGADVYVGSASRPALLVGRHSAAFAARPLPCASDDEQAVVGARGAAQLVLVCAGGAGAGQQHKTVWRSADQGRSWSRAGSPPGLTGTTLSLTSAADFLFDHQQVLVSRDADRTWQRVLGSDGGLEQGGFVAADLGFAIGGFGSTAASALQLTRDGGRTWHRVAF